MTAPDLTLTPQERADLLVALDSVRPHERERALADVVAAVEDILTAREWAAQAVDARARERIRASLDQIRGQM